MTFHRTRRNAAALTSELSEVAGVGEKTLNKLLRHFGSTERVRLASEEELVKVVGRAAARRIQAHFTTQVILPGLPILP